MPQLFRARRGLSICGRAIEIGGIMKNLEKLWETIDLGDVGQDFDAFFDSGKDFPDFGLGFKMSARILVILLMISMISVI